MKYGKSPLLIFDVDGTLYYLSVLRFVTAVDVVISFLLGKTNANDILTFLKYRKFRDSRRFSLEYLSRINLDFCAANQIPINHLELIIEKFTQNMILKYIKMCQRRYLVSFIKSQLNNGIDVCFLSDYPIIAKLQCLEIDVSTSKCYSSAESSINQLKPSSTGLRLLLENELNLPRSVILIGDSVELDGVIAEKENIQFVKVNWRNIRKIRMSLDTDYDDCSRP